MKRKVPVKMCLYLMVFTAFILVSGYGAEAATIWASADAQTHGTYPTTNYGGSQTAATNFNIFTFVRFELPALAPGEEFASAKLWGFYYFDTWDSNDVEHSWYRVSDDSWDENTITWNTKPTESGPKLASWTPTGSSSGASSHTYDIWQEFTGDISSTLNAESDGKLSLVLHITDLSKNSVETFRTKEYDPAGSDPVGSRGFKIEYTTRQKPTPTPEPATLTILGLSLFGLAGLRRRFSR